jgi:hypothetical protein
MADGVDDEVDDLRSEIFPEVDERSSGIPGAVEPDGDEVATGCIHDVGSLVDDVDVEDDLAGDELKTLVDDADVELNKVGAVSTDDVDVNNVGAVSGDESGANKALLEAGGSVFL